MNVILLLIESHSDSIATCVYIFLNEKLFHLLGVQNEFIATYLSDINVLSEQSNSFCGEAVFTELVSLL